MSRTIRRLPTGQHSKKNRARIGHYNYVYPFPASAIHLLKRPPPIPPPRAIAEVRFGVWLHKPHSYDRADDYPYYGADEFRQSANSIAGPKWVDADGFHKVQHLLAKGWTCDRRTRRRQIGPEDWNYDTVDLGPDFRKQRVFLPNHEWDEAAHDTYREYLRAHRIVVRNGHYKDHHPGYAAFKRRQKQTEHQMERSRGKAALRKLVAEALTPDEPVAEPASPE